MRTLKFLLSNQLKSSKVVQPVSGFTLIELLVAMLIAFLVITPLLGFMVNILATDRQEQAKANSEQEIQSALDYISRDLQQALYIYDAEGIDAIKDELPSPTATDRVPVLVFWKRELIQGAIPVGGGEDDTFVYSLVAYYLVKDSNTTWSNAARITRWQIRDGVEDNTASGVSCLGYSNKYVSGYCPSGGFAPFNLDVVGSIHDKMKAWKRLRQYTDADDVVTDVSYSDSPQVLVDFIDQTITNDAPPKACTSTIPDSLNTRNTAKMTGFYACVEADKITAQVFLRGNALARLQSNNLDYNESKRTYYPTTSTQVQGRSFLFTR
ncbi:MAG: prepilin-type N-terminal cleavage/methylation domain-containing protein [Nodularia sp. (in: Bacteria)]|nr:MAG: prepilin-type N-terminal cleavage/methylation domain-containing protein [Nodularia sp. (in: cyanobacteria)]